MLQCFDGGGSLDILVKLGTFLHSGSHIELAIRLKASTYLGHGIFNGLLYGIEIIWPCVLPSFVVVYCKITC